MSVTDANPPHPTFVDDYVLREVDTDWMETNNRVKTFIHIDQSECIMCAVSYTHLTLPTSDLV